MAKRVKPSMGCGYLVMVLLLAGGLALLVLATNRFEAAGRTWNKDAIAPGILGALMVVGSGVYLRFARRIVKESEAEEARCAQYPDQPWMWKKEWAGGVIAAREPTSTVVFWIFTVFWNAVSFPALWIILTKPQRDHGAYIVLMFPAIGLGLLANAIYKTIQGRKFGRERFLLSRLPGAVGGYVGGMIEVPARLAPTDDVRLVLRCIRNEEHGTGKDRSVQEVVQWEHEERIAPERLVSGADRTEIPVLFYVPDTCQPTDDSVRNSEVFWRLSATAAVPGVDFAASFVVPVFRTGETVAPPEPGKPLLDDYRSGPPDPAMLREAGARREAGAYFFGTAHLLGTRIIFTAIALGFGALWAGLWGNHVHWIVWTVSVGFGAIFLFAALDLWFARFELLIGPEEITVRKPRPWGTKETRVPRREVAGIGTAKSMTIGTTQYYRLELNGAEVAGSAGGRAESFAVRKLRFQLEQSGKNLANSADLAALEERLQHAPKFTVIFAKHIPGIGMAEKLGAMIMDDIHGGK